MRPAFLCSCLLAAFVTASPAEAAQSFSSSPGFGKAPYVDANKDPALPEAAQNLWDAAAGSTPFIELRYRYETVDQGNLPNEAQAHTLRTIGGFQTAPYKDFRMAFAFGNTMPIGSNDRYNDGVNNLTAYPRIGDRRDTHAQLAHVQWFGLPQTSVTAGRHYLVIDNQRWVSTSNWRQNRHSFDGLTLKNSSLPDLTLLYSYLFNINRSPGTNTFLGAYKMNTNIFHATYTGVPDLKLSGYAYLMDFDDHAALSNATFGLRAEARHAFTDTFALTGAGEYARQTDYANSPSSFALDYYTIEPGVVIGKDKGPYGSFTAKAGYEVLGGNGTQGLRTPLASQHSQNGWAEIFSTVPASGVSDAYLSGAYRYQLPVEALAPTRVQIAWHRFSSDTGNTHYGDELNVGLSQVFFDHYTFELQYAAYQSDAFSPSTHKLMLIGMLQY